MTLFDIQRLPRKILDVSRESGSPPTAPKLAEDFAAACHATNLRLQQCEAMLKAGDRHQAIQLAETQPNLLDCVTALEFQDADRWRAYCEQHGLPVGDRIDAHSVRTLNECYAQGISTDHPLYAAYRNAVLLRNDEEALQVLQSIVRLNPTDANAATELARLDAKVLQARIIHLSELIEVADPESIAAEVVSIETFGFKNRPADESWRRAQAIRCVTLLAEAERERWAEALATLEHIRRLQSEYSLELPADVVHRIEALEGWSRAEQDKDKCEREFRSVLTELRYQIQQSEEKDTAARQVQLVEMKDDFERLNKVWRNVESFTRPIPDEAVAAFRKRSALLEAEIVRRSTVRRRALTAGVISALLLGGAIAWFTLAQYRARDLTGQLRQAVAARKVRTAEKLLEHLDTRHKPISSSTLTDAAASAEGFVAKEHNLFKTFEEALVKLPKDFGGSPSVTEVSRIGGQLSEAQAALGSLAPDLKAEEEPKLRAFERRWEKHLSDSSGVVNETVEKWVASGEKQCAELDYRSPVEQARALLVALSNQVYKINAYESGFTNYLPLRPDLLQRAAAVRVKFVAYDRELRKLDEGNVALQNAQTSSAHSNALGLLASSEFSSSPLAKAAAAVQAVDPSEETALRLLLGATNGSTWAFLKRDRAKRFVPETAFPAEQAIFRQLNDDPAVSAQLQRVRLWLSEDGKKTVEWLTMGSFSQSGGWKTIKAYDYNDASESCSFSDHDYGFFDGRFRLSPTQPIYRMELLGSADETAAFRSVGFQDTFATSGYKRPLLEVLDAIKDSNEGSPVFRAYLFQRITDIMQLQPESWGLAFAPAVSAHRDAIRAILGKSDSGAWFVPMRVKECREKLDRFFASIKSVSYMRQASGLLGLAHEAVKSGLKYVGFISLDGKPHYVAGAQATELWGYGPHGKQPVFLSNSSDPRTTFIATAMPLSPLFSLNTTREELFANAGVNPNESLFAGVLPPLFALPPRGNARP